jgi:hypothetical protein
MIRYFDSLSGVVQAWSSRQVSDVVGADGAFALRVRCVDPAPSSPHSGDDQAVAFRYP